MDLKRLTKVTAGDPKRLKELLDLYFNQAEQLIKNLEAAIANGSAKDVNSIAHKFCGASSSCGIMGIVPPLRELEWRAKEGNLSNAPEMFAQVKRQYERTTEFLNSHMESLKNS